MKRRNRIFTFGILFLFIVGLIAVTAMKNPANDQILSYTVDLKKHDLQLYWKNDKGEILKSIDNLKSYLAGKNKTLLFATNGGMFKKDNSPQGLLVQNGKVTYPIDISSGNGNFYLQPNGVFYISNNVAAISATGNFRYTSKIKYATQSGPMLVIRGEIHSAFKQGSTNLNIRNGVGILPDGKIVFAMSKQEINFYDFATYFKNLGCENALYLDGFVSRTYLPEKNWVQTDGNFGVMIGVTKKGN